MRFAVVFAFAFACILHTSISRAETLDEARAACARVDVPRDARVAACRAAVNGAAMPEDFRALVAALMAGPAAPTSDDLVEALMLVRAARGSTAGELWSYAAELDIAERLGDEAMIDRCVRELTRIAPEHAETLRAQRLAAARTPTWWVGLGWLAIGAAFVLRGARAGTRWSARRAAIAAMAAALLLPSIARADEANGPNPGAAAGDGMSEWPIDDANPEKSVPSNKQRDTNPLQFGYWRMDIAFKAEQAANRGDKPAAIRYYAALGKAVPDRSFAFVKMCGLYEAEGDRANAVTSCAAALGREGVTADDYAHYFRLVLSGALDAKSIEDLDAVVTHLRASATSSVLADQLECELGARLSDEKRLAECTKGLALAAPNDAKTISFEWALAMRRGNIAEARTLIGRARDAGMSADGLRRMTEATAAAEPLWLKALRDWRTLAGVLLLAAALVARALLRRGRGRSTQSVTQSPRTEASA